MGKGQKGNKFEREFCKQLSLWWSWNKRDDIFWRTSASGARATIRSRKNIKTADSYGDITAMRKSGKLLTQNCLIELKRGYTTKKGKKNISWIDVLNIIDTTKNIKTKPALYEWWLKAEKQAKEAKRKYILIIFRRDRKEACLMLNEKIFLICNQYSLSEIKYIKTIFKKAKNKKVIIININDFFKWCPPSTFKHILRKYPIAI